MNDNTTKKDEESYKGEPDEKTSDDRDARFWRSLLRMRTSLNRGIKRYPAHRRSPPRYPQR